MCTFPLHTSALLFCTTHFARYAAERGAVYIQDITEMGYAVPYKKQLSGKADNTIRSYVMRVRGLFTFAVEQRWIEENPFGRIVTREGVTEPPTILSRDQLDTVLYHAKNYTLYTIYIVGGDAGLRISEILNLELNHVDFTNRLLTVKKGKGDKTRVVPMTPRLTKELKLYIDIRRPKTGNTNHIFLMPRGRVVQPGFVNLDLKQIAAEQFGLNLTSHMLRHSFATTLYEQKKDIVGVAELLGHKSINTTERYLHVSRERTRQLIEGLNK
ncbi:tyrosine-type recombinase/integrase [Exiguobacterium sp.]|uniref:tyrosine-type recombinase/integrase n=1 Tax=Exiguobacterium sp. TaxID=44751 RepID=UPI00263AA05C|nr:tyrosine-type recombinase/integrase [Exiguobacterium sp.]